LSLDRHLLIDYDAFTQSSSLIVLLNNALVAQRKSKIE